VQDTFVQAFGKLHTLKEPRAFAPWLFRMTTCAVVDTLRRRSVLRRIGLWPKEDLDTETLISNEASPEIAAELHAVYSVLGRFPTDERVALVLRRVEELTLEEIASYTGWSLATVKRKLVRAEERLWALTEKERAS
jgi:RNA polymerase sigma-70 factor (ECF subfamily)